MDGTICRESTLPQVAFLPRQRTFTDTLLRAVEVVLQWHERAKSRRALLGLSDRMLSDIGIDRATAQVEGDRPFWKP
jgi:uncharacterized protein YjiS (DUF1127 family)